MQVFVRLFDTRIGNIYSILFLFFFARAACINCVICLFGLFMILCCCRPIFTALSTAIIHQCSVYSIHALCSRLQWNYKWIWFICSALQWHILLCGACDCVNCMLLLSNETGNSIREFYQRGGSIEHVVGGRSMLLFSYSFAAWDCALAWARRRIGPAEARVDDEAICY